jgi:zinc protease
MSGLAVTLVFLFVTPQRTLATPEIDHWTTESGARAYFVHAPEIPILDIRIVFAAGSARDGGRPGLAHFTNVLLKEGAGELDADAFSERLGLTGASMRTGSLRDMAWVALRTLVDPQYREPATGLLGDVLREPRFEEAAIERQRARLLVSLKQQQQSAGTLASKALFKAVYAEHPYASPVKGTEQAIAAITPADIRAFHQQYYVAENAVLAIVGAVSREQAETIAEQLTRDMRRGEPAPALPPVKALLRPETAHIEFPSIQSHVRVGQPGLKRGDPDYFPLLVGNHVLGGNSLVSILFQEIRDKRGLSYSAHSYFSPMAQLGPFIASLETDGSQSQQAVSVLKQTLADFVRDGPGPEALQAAKQNLIGGFPLRIDSNLKIVEYIAMIGFYALPLDYLMTFPGRVAEVTETDVKEAFRRRLDLNRMVTVTVGQAPS